METRVHTVIVGAGPAGLTCALRLKALRPSHSVVVIDKSEIPGGHNLSGAVFETAGLEELLDSCVPAWREGPAGDAGKALFARRVTTDSILFLAGKSLSFEISPLVYAARALGLGVGAMAHKGDAIVSASALTKWLTALAIGLGVEVLNGFSVKQLLWDAAAHAATGVKLVDQGVQSDGSRLESFVEGETVLADSIVLAEGCDGLLTEQFVKDAGLVRRHAKLFSIGVKELIEVTPEQFGKFGPNRVVHAMGYPLWAPLVGPSMFGGGVMYAMEENRIAAGMIVGLDWKYHDFNPQDALTAFKAHSFVKPFLQGGTVIEAGAKMIPEGGWRAMPRDRAGNLGTSNVILAGDGAGLVNMIKIKGLHNAIDSGRMAAEAIDETPDQPARLAAAYTARLSRSNVEKEMRAASKFRQTVATFGPTIGLPLASAGVWLPDFRVHEDFRIMTKASYPFRATAPFDKMTFASLAATHHREGQPSHLTILDREICDTKCRPVFKAPCITFCPAGVYEEIQGIVKPANPSNCFHCKTCQRKCPFDNIRWTVPEGGGGPRYTRM
jgi:electron-transferring-flavoprotein dehydrogenase